MDGPSKHLSWIELQCKDGTPYPNKWRDNRAVDLALAFEDVRAIYNKPIKILSGYRSPSHNRLIGGARFSQHVEGRALDLRPPNGISLEVFWTDIKHFARQFSIWGIGKYKTFVHIDVRPSDRLIVWMGAGIKDDR
jgi:uncharacterized protein YcbK (DUF882 family)